MVDTGPDIASAGNGGVATASADGGTVVIDNVNSGGNAGNAIGVGDTYGDVPVDFELLYEVAALVNQSRDQAIRAPSCFDLYVKRLPQIGNLTPQLVEEVAVIMGRSRRCLKMVRRFLVAVRS